MDFAFWQEGPLVGGFVYIGPETDLALHERVAAALESKLRRAAETLS